MILEYEKQRCACTKNDTETLVRPLLRSACCLMNMVDDVPKALSCDKKNALGKGSGQMPA